MGNSRSGHGYDLKLREMPHKVRELHCAVMDNDRESVRTLVANGANVNFPWYNPTNPSIKDGSTPLICAVSLNRTDILDLLLKAGAYINKCDRNGCTPIYKAAFHGRPALIQLLARAGADVNLADFQGKTPLYICVNNAIVHSSSCRLAVQKLIHAGAIVDKCDHNGVAPIHMASHWKLVHLLEMLIAAGSDVNLVDQRGRSPLYICISSLSTKLYVEDLRHQLPCILTLFKAGADMLNLVEWLLFKGPGISDNLIDSGEFKAWYAMQLAQPQTLKNICRKSIQMTIGNKRDLFTISQKLPVPNTLQTFLARKMFFRDEIQPP